MTATSITWAWLYYIFIVTLSTIRQRQNVTHCAEEYGTEKWVEYQSQVKYRIFPTVY